MSKRCPDLHRESSRQARGASADHASAFACPGQRPLPSPDDDL